MGCLLLLLCTPVGLSRMFTVMGQLLVKPTILKDLDEQIYIITLEEEALQRRLNGLSSSVEYNRGEKRLQHRKEIWCILLLWFSFLLRHPSWFSWWLVIFFAYHCSLVAEIRQRRKCHRVRKELSPDQSNICTNPQQGHNNEASRPLHEHQV
ncbi:hypothetical protein HPG69_007773 [Diceros bicornis minor]|uniref:Uncharacterized protein n=1 Tax=Diceros bicornis minor TaxID=77932 RepID=A0A7J7EAT1_DICBM|nr:hypothetical protein HPG69_007773 [Diceros bicornis minor]